MHTCIYIHTHACACTHTRARVASINTHTCAHNLVRDPDTKAVSWIYTISYQWNMLAVSVHNSPSVIDSWGCFSFNTEHRPMNVSDCLLYLAPLINTHINTSLWLWRCLVKQYNTWPGRRDVAGHTDESECFSRVVEDMIKPLRDLSCLKRRDITC